mmetsp:Transcript_62275/g.148643  ORF Transcript_62275/g.148643 Transcript_62275/m.148643 type:complete len:117 (+) Transcript_62275:347-697(+)
MSGMLLQDWFNGSTGGGEEAVTYAWGTGDCARRMLPIGCTATGTGDVDRHDGCTGDVHCRTGFPAVPREMPNGIIIVDDGVDSLAATGAGGAAIPAPAAVFADETCWGIPRAVGCF